MNKLGLKIREMVRDVATNTDKTSILGFIILVIKGCYELAVNVGNQIGSFFDKE